MSADSPQGSCYIWFITSFLFICIISGGAFLVLYMTQPETPSTSWYPIVGVALVCLPWFFWFLTCSYRIISRKFGFRMVCFGTDVYPVDSVHVDGPGGGSLANANTNTRNEEHSSDTRQVHFGGAVVVADTGGEGGSSRGGNNPSHGGGSTSSRNSNESEMPLKLSMAS